MKKVYSILTSILVLSMFIVPLSFYGQDENPDDTKKEKKKSDFSGYLFIAGDIGPSWFHGDLARYGAAPDFENTQINGSLAIGWQFLSWLNIYGKVNRGFVKGEKENVPPKNNIGAGKGVHQDMKMDMDFYGGDIQIGVNLMNLFGGYKDRLFSTTIHGGLGQTQWKSRTYDLNTDQRLMTSGFSQSNTGYGTRSGINDRNVELTVPFGAELTFAVAEKWDVYGDYTFTWMETDYADGVKHGEMSFKNDTYSQFNIGLRYKFRSNKIKKMAENFGDVQLKSTPDPLEEVGDSVEVTIKGTFPPKYFAKNAVMCFTPVLEYEGGETAFPTKNFIGEGVDGDGTMISWANGGSFSYTEKIPYDPAMDNSELVISPTVYEYKGEVYSSCDAAADQGKSYTADERKLADGVINTSKLMRPIEVADFAGHNYQFETISTQESNIFYQVNLANLNKSLPLNKDAANKDALSNSISDMEKGWLVKDIVINGWASPEGEETFNEGLSMKRAETAEKFIIKKIQKAAKKNDMIEFETIEGIEFVLAGNGPDWNGFMQAVEASNIKDKNAIINVINSADYSQKEAEIRNMILIYPELERDILPPLRRAVIDVNTYEPKRNAALIADLAMNGPQELEIEELFYAATLTDDNGVKREVYGNIIEIHPENYRVYNNMAALELEEGNVDLAKEHLDRALELNANSYEVWNNLGIYNSMISEWNEAEVAFKKSNELGGDVSYNLGVVSIRNGEYAQAVANLSKYKCDFNLGLAQLLNDEYTAAEKTLNCSSPQDGETMYLLAVTGARQDDKAKTLDYLTKAIKQDAAYKDAARMDREFFKYYNEADFKALVGSN